MRAAVLRVRDGMDGLARVKKALDVGDQRFAHHLLGTVRGAANVRREDGVRKGEHLYRDFRFMLENVPRIPRESPVAQRCAQRDLVDQITTSNVDQKALWTQCVDDLRIDSVVCR